MTERLAEVACYRRVVGASLERVWENVLDWEHLPWLHSSAFASIEVQDASPRGWRARVGSRVGDRVQPMTIEIRTERERGRYVTRTLDGSGAGTEIWTELDPTGERATAIEVRFLVPGVSGAMAERYGASYERLYARLWDEDEQMMQHREKMIEAARSRRSVSERILLGPEEELRRRLPETVEIGGMPYRLCEIDGSLAVFSSVCPHLLGPLDEGELAVGIARCPWHGYEFDTRSGLSCDGRSLRLSDPGKLLIENGLVYWQA